MTGNKVIRLSCVFLSIVTKVYFEKGMTGTKNRTEIKKCNKVLSLILDKLNLVFIN